MVNIYSNSLGSGDYILIKDNDGDLIFAGNKIGAFDLQLILQNLGIHADLIGVTDAEMEELDG
jgi:hypothetical protein